MHKYYEKKKEFLQEFFDNLNNKKEQTEERDILGRKYTLKYVCPMGQKETLIVGFQKHNSAVVLFGTQSIDEMNLSGKHPYLEIVADYDLKGFYYQMSSSRNYSFSNGANIHTGIAGLLADFSKSYEYSELALLEKED